MWWNVGETQEVLLFSSVKGDIAHIAVQLQHNVKFSNCVLLYWLHKLYCSGRLEEVHKGNGCSYTICTEMVLQWHCLLCSTEIDCCSTGATVALSAVQYSDRLLSYRCYSGTVCCAVQRQTAVLPVLQWHCLLCSTTIDCCSTGAIVAMSAVQYSYRLLFYFSLLTAWHRALCHSTNCQDGRSKYRPQFRSLPTHSCS